MYKTIWMIHDEIDNTDTKLTYYHLGEKPKFPTWYFEENHSYNVEMMWNLKLVKTPKLFFKCLIKFYIIQ